MKAGRAVVAVAVAALGVQGCAGGAARREAFGLGRVDDPSFGLPKFAEFRDEMPIEDTTVFRANMREATARRAPSASPTAEPVDAHPSWRADFPVERVPVRRRFFLSGFAVGFSVRLAYAAVAGADSGRLLGSDLGSAVGLGALTGLLAWGYSFRLPPATLERRLSADRIPPVEETAVFREWSSPPR